MNIYTLKELQSAYQSKKKFKYLFFWGHTPKIKGSVDKSCLSQWFSAGFDIDGVYYPTAEHYMMAQKARLFGADDIFQQILVAASPKQVKSLGRQVLGFKEDVWLSNRERIVYEANFAKFSQNLELRAFLHSTGNKILVEASPVDKIWGIGLSQNDLKAENPLQWQGLNLLGFALMKVRDDLLNS